MASHGSLLCERRQGKIAPQAAPSPERPSPLVTTGRAVPPPLALFHSPLFLRNCAALWSPPFGDLLGTRRPVLRLWGAVVEQLSTIRQTTTALKAIGQAHRSGRGRRRACWRRLVAPSGQGWRATRWSGAQQRHDLEEVVRNATRTLRLSGVRRSAVSAAACYGVQQPAAAGRRRCPSPGRRLAATARARVAHGAGPPDSASRWRPPERRPSPLHRARRAAPVGAAHLARASSTGDATHHCPVFFDDGRAHTSLLFFFRS